MEIRQMVNILESLETLRDAAHENSVNHGFWDEKTVPWNMGEKIALIHTELSEMFEAWRKSIGNSEKDIQIMVRGAVDSEGYPAIRRITAIEEEAADVFIRMFDLCGKLDIDVGRVVMAKMAYNRNRPHMHGGLKC